MKSRVLLLSLAITVSVHADPKVVISDECKAEVQVEETGSSTSGGMRQEVAVVSVNKGFFSDPIPLDERIVALESKTAFYRLLKQQGVDLDRAVSGDYTGMKLSDVLAELLPDMPVEFMDVDDSVTVLKMTATDAKLEKILDLLDDGAGVYFSFSERGMCVSSKPM